MAVLWPKYTSSEYTDLCLILFYNPFLAKVQLSIHFHMRDQVYDHAA